MIEERQEELAALYALGMLEGVELQEFEAQRRANLALAHLVAEHEESASALAYGVAARIPSPELKARVMSSISDSAWSDRRVISFPFWKVALPWALAAAFAIMASILVQQRGELKKEVAALEQRDALSQVKIATLNSLVDGYGQGTAVVVWEPEKQTGVIKVANMPQPRADQDYQLWVIDPTHKLPVDAGVFHPEGGLSRTTFKPVEPVPQAQKFAISLERKGGAPQHEGPIVMLGE